jgi:hypothetical protein
MAVKMEDRLSTNQKQQLDQMKSPKKKQEHLSFKEWEDIMGTNRDTYERRNGAVRRK